MQPTIPNQILYGLTIAAGVTLPPLAKAMEPPGVSDAPAEFNSLDGDGDGDTDGRVFTAEHATGARKMFAAMDANRDGQVSTAEMDAANGRPAADPAQRERLSAEKIRTIDTDGDTDTDTDTDGLLNEQEHAAGSARMFGRMDLDEDRSPTPEELAAGHAKLMRRGPG